MLSTMYIANNGSGTGFIILVLLVCTPLGWILLIGLFMLLGSLFPSSSSTSSQGSSNEGSDPPSWRPKELSRSEEIDADFAAKQAAQQQRDNDWEERQAERDSGQYGIWRKRS